jgi:hypothetical protein
MKTTVNIYQFRNEFQSIRPNNFSYEGLGILFDYLEELENDTGEELELDVIALCCDYNEETLNDIINNYDIEIDEDEDKLEQVKYFLEQNTMIVGVLDDEETIIYQVF